MIYTTKCFTYIYVINETLQTMATWPFTLTFCDSTVDSDGSSFNVFFNLENSGLPLKPHTTHIAGKLFSEQAAQITTLTTDSCAYWAVCHSGASRKVPLSDHVD